MLMLMLQEVIDNLLTKIYDVISFSKFQFLWVLEELFCGCHVGLLD